ncbi:hypothetical protein, partial [Enterobacter asburiae]|uniref:hypothetical protein n=1 Tax=Enterobacter asburiae TaxID=61645 RepID=UPI0032AF2B16
FGFAENTDDLFVGKTLLHGDVLMWLMKTLLTSGCTNQRGAGHHASGNKKTAMSAVYICTEMTYLFIAGSITVKRFGDPVKMLRRLE